MRMGPYLGLNGRASNIFVVTTVYGFRSGSSPNP
jgi:hypothetical protein